MPTLTKEQRDAIRARVDAATKGPWLQAHHVDEPRALIAADRPAESLLALDRDGMAIMDKVADAAFIASARSDVPALLDDLDAAEREIETLRAVAAAWAGEAAEHLDLLIFFFQRVGTCAYCGHRDVKEDLPAHIEQCEKHPLGAAKKREAELVAALRRAREAVDGDDDHEELAVEIRRLIGQPIHPANCPCRQDHAIEVRGRRLDVQLMHGAEGAASAWAVLCCGDEDDGNTPEEAIENIKAIVEEYDDEMLDEHALPTVEG